MGNPHKDLLLRLGKINTYRRGEQRAPHKPLYFLLLLAKLQQGQERLSTFEEIRPQLAQALRLFAPRVVSVHPQYPFWWLKSDRLAEVASEQTLTIRKSNNDPTVSSLISCKARGGLLADDYEALRSDFDLQSLVAHKILDAHFPQVIHGDIINYFGLRLNTPHRDDYATQAQFQSHVLKAYDGCCAISGLSIRYLETIVGIEATHICWPQMGGNDAVSNGVAMTALHTRLYQLGIFTITPDYRIKLCEDAHINHAATAVGLEDKQKIRVPIDVRIRPDPTALRWHMKSVFRG